MGRASRFFHLALAAQALGVSCLKPNIRAESNRDGVVDVQNSPDSGNMALWTSQHGAIFLPNIGDKHMRCTHADAVGNPWSNDELSACHDASGHILLAPEYAAPLKTLPLNVSADALRVGITMGINGRELVTNTSTWDGLVTVRFDVTDGITHASDAVALRMAPVLTHNHLQSVETLLSTASNASDPIQLNFVQQLDDAREEAGITTPLLLFNQSSDVWAQDFIEPGYASMPGPNGPISIPLRGPGIGGFQPSSGSGSGFGRREINSYGNLETIPPYTSKSGVSYKAGRIIMDKHFDQLPARALLDFFYAQQVQTPLVLETGWLLIGHVDEFVQFLPYNNDLGFTISIADTESAIILDVLANTPFADVNAYAQRHIDSNLQTLLSEIPLDPADVIRVPTLFHDPGYVFSMSWGSDGLPPLIEPVMEGERKLMAFYPASINRIVIGKRYLSPKPWGPVVNGMDVLASAVERAYARAGMSVGWVDDYLSHHVGAGEIHCGSNTFRQTDLVWWD
ncbi:hypothetical protein BJX64DRAFT_297221 [Aspergillus heterothallicus]